MDLDDSLTLTLSELEQGLFIFRYFVFNLYKAPCEGIPKITGTTDLFDAHPAIEASYNIIVSEAGHTDTEDTAGDSPPPLLFSQFEQFLFLIQKYFMLCKVQGSTLQKNKIPGFGRYPCLESNDYRYSHFRFSEMMKWRRTFRSQEIN